MLKKRYERGLCIFIRRIDSAPHNMVDSITGRISALTGIDHTENVLNVIKDMGRVDNVQLIVGMTYSFRKESFVVNFSFKAIITGDIYTKPKVADMDSKNPTSYIINGLKKTKSADARGSDIWIVLFLPKRRAERERELIIQALTMDDDSPENSAKSHIIKSPNTIFIFLGRKNSSLFVSITKIVILYPDAATIWLTPDFLILSSNELLNSRFLPKSIPANSDDCGSESVISIFFIILSFKSIKNFLTPIPPLLSDMFQHTNLGSSSIKNMPLF